MGKHLVFLFMPRSVRIEYPGARYHVINRGNHRQDLFTIDKTGEAFVRTGGYFRGKAFQDNGRGFCIESFKKRFAGAAEKE